MLDYTILKVHILYVTNINLIIYSCSQTTVFAEVIFRYAFVSTFPTLQSFWHYLFVNDQAQFLWGYPENYTWFCDFMVHKNLKKIIFYANDLSETSFCWSPLENQLFHYIPQDDSVRLVIKTFSDKKHWLISYVLQHVRRHHLSSWTEPINQVN